MNTMEIPTDDLRAAFRVADSLINKMPATASAASVLPMLLAFRAEVAVTLVHRAERVRAKREQEYPRG